MNMPGFTGEASLYKTGRHYYKAGKLTQTDGVYPAITIFDQLPVYDRFLWRREATLACCRKCSQGCRRECLYRDTRCYNSCLDSLCTRYCNAYHLGGCRQLIWS